MVSTYAWYWMVVQLWSCSRAWLVRLPVPCIHLDTGFLLYCHECPRYLCVSRRQHDSTSLPICPDSCDSAGRLCRAVGVVGHPFLGRHGLTEGMIMPPFHHWRGVSAGTLFLLRWRMTCRGTDACDPTCSAISSAALNISAHVVVSGSFLQPCNNSFTTASSSAAWTRSQFFCWSCFGRGSKACIHVSAVHKAMMKSNLSIVCR